MDDATTAKRELKLRLLRDVDYLCRRGDLRWNHSIVETISDLRDTHAVIFGGTLRSLLLGRSHRRLGRPRDVDIVVDGMPLEVLKNRFRTLISRETRFGGLQLRRNEWQFDIWPLAKTWAFTIDNATKPSFESLPFTTFFNIEAAAVDLFSRDGMGRKIYSGDDRFFDGILSRTLEINFERNPFPSLCVVRSLVFASSQRFAIGPHLAAFLAEHGPSTTDDELIQVQRKHYGSIRCEAAAMRAWIEHIVRHAHRDCGPIMLPQWQQMQLRQE